MYMILDIIVVLEETFSILVRLVSTDPCLLVQPGTCTEPYRLMLIGFDLLLLFFMILDSTSQYTASYAGSIQVPSVLETSSGLELIAWKSLTEMVLKLRLSGPCDKIEVSYVVALGLFFHI